MSKKFLVIIPEIHHNKYIVEAKDKKDAIDRLIESESGGDSEGITNVEVTYESSLQPDLWYVYEH